MLAGTGSSRNDTDAGCSIVISYTVAAVHNTQKLVAEQQPAGQSDIELVIAAYPEHLLHWVHALAEHVDTELLKSGTCDTGVEVNTLKQAVNLNGGGG